MGSQASKMDRQNDGQQPKLPKILSRKLESIKKRKFSSSSLFKKSLLKDGSEDSSTKGPITSTVSFRDQLNDDDDSVVGSAKIAPEPIEEPVVSDKDDSKGDDDNNAEAMEKLTLGGKEDHEKIVEENGRAKKDGLNLMCPGSPSFRCYLTESEKEDRCSNVSEDNLKTKGSFSDIDVSVAKELDEPRSPGKELGSKRKKRGSKMTRFKNFLKVRTCYYPYCGGQEMNGPLIAPTPAAL